MIRKFIKDSAVYAVPSFVSSGLSLFLVPLYTRVLSPGEYGSLDLIIVFASIVNLTITLQVSQGVARFYTSETDPGRKVLYAASSFWFTLFCYGVFLGFTLLFKNVLSELIMGQADLQFAFQIGVVYIFANGILSLIHNQLRWELQSVRYAIISLTVALITAGVSIWLVYSIHLGLAGLLLGMLSGSAVGSVLGLWWLRSSFQCRFSGAQLKEMLCFSTPLVLAGISVWVSLYVDRLMIQYFLNIDEVGIYGIGYRLASTSSIVMVGFQGALTPLIYTHYQHSSTPSQLEKIFRIFMIFALLTLLILSLFASNILALMTTPSYYGASKLAVFLVPAMLLSNMYIFAPGIGIAKKNKYILWISIFGALLNTLLNIILVPLFGIIGASIATLASSLLVFVVYMAMSQKLYYVPHKWRELIACVCIAALLVVFGLYFDHETTQGIVMKSLILLFGMLIFIHLLGLRSEIKMVLLNSFFFKVK